MPERANIEFTVFDENGVDISYDRKNKMLIIEGWFNYIQQMDKFEIPLDEFLKSLLIPIEDIRSSYGIDCWGKPVKSPGRKKKQKSKQVKSKKPKLFLYRRNKPSCDLVCRWCGVVFATTDKDRKFCSHQCSKDWFREQSLSGVAQKKAAETMRKRREVSEKIKETKRKKNEL